GRRFECGGFMRRRYARAGLLALLLFACEHDNPGAPNTIPNRVATATQAPESAVVLLQENFDDPGFANRGWYDNPAMTVITTDHEQGAGALQVHFARGASAPDWGGAARHQFTPTSTLYVSYWVKYASNWVGSGTLDDPHELYVLSSLDGQYSGLARD